MFGIDDWLRSAALAAYPGADGYEPRPPSPTFDGVDAALFAAAALSAASTRPATTSLGTAWLLTFGTGMAGGRVENCPLKLPSRDGVLRMFWDAALCVAKLDAGFAPQLFSSCCC